MDSPTFRMDGLVLRPIGEADQEHVFRGLSHPAVILHYGVSYASYEATAQQMEWYAELERTGTGIWWAIVHAQEGRFLGAIGINSLQRQHRKAEIGFWLLPDNWGQGIIGKVLPAVLEHGFRTLGLHRMEAMVETGNVASGRVLRKAGFMLEGTLRECEVKHGCYISLELWALLDPAR